jgi:hypothetical protein
MFSRMHDKMCIETSDYIAFIFPYISLQVSYFQLHIEFLLSVKILLTEGVQSLYHRDTVGMNMTTLQISETPWWSSMRITL